MHDGVAEWETLTDSLVWMTDDVLMQYSTWGDTERPFVIWRNPVRRSTLTDSVMSGETFPIPNVDGGYVSYDRGGIPQRWMVNRRTGGVKCG